MQRTRIKIAADDSRIATRCSAGKAHAQTKTDKECVTNTGANGNPDGTADSATDGTADSATDGTADSATDGTADSATDRTADSATDGTADSPA